MTVDLALRSASAADSGQDTETAAAEASSGADFALTFDAEAVHLMEREAGAWSWRGAARLDATDLRGRMAALRRLMPQQAEDRVALIIPDDQILYTALSVDPGLPRADAVLQAVDGLTPYAVDDLAVDWRDEADDRVKVAAVWRQTLAEAEAFATRNGFVPAGLIADTEGHELPGGACFAAHDGTAVAGRPDRIDPSARDDDGDTETGAPRPDREQGEAAGDSGARHEDRLAPALAGTKAVAMRNDPSPKRGETAGRVREGAHAPEVADQPASEASRSMNDAGQEVAPVKGSPTDESGSGENLSDTHHEGDDPDAAESAVPTSEELAASIARIRALSRRAASAADAPASSGPAGRDGVTLSDKVDAQRAIARDRVATQRRQTERRAEAAAALQAMTEADANAVAHGVPPEAVERDADAVEMPAAKERQELGSATASSRRDGNAGPAAAAAEGVRVTSPSIARKIAAPLGAPDHRKPTPLPDPLASGTRQADLASGGKWLGEAVRRATGRHSPAGGGLGIMLALLAAGLLVVFLFGGKAEELPVTAAEADASMTQPAVAATDPPPPPVEPAAAPLSMGQESAEVPAKVAVPETTARSDAGTTAISSQAGTPAPEPVPASPSTGGVAREARSTQAAPAAVAEGPVDAQAAEAAAPAAPAAETAPSPTVAPQATLPKADTPQAAPGAAPRDAIESAIAEAVADVPTPQAPGSEAPSVTPRPQALALPEPRPATSLPATAADPAPALPAGAAAGSPPATVADAPLTSPRPAPRPARATPEMLNAAPPATANAVAPSRRPATLDTKPAPAAQKPGGAASAPPPPSSAPPGASPARETESTGFAPPRNGAAASPAQAPPVRSGRPLPRPERRGAAFLPPSTAPAARSMVPSIPTLRLALAGDPGLVAESELQLLALVPPDLARGALRVNAPSEAAFLRLAASAPLLRVAQSRPPRRELAAASVPPLRKDAVEAAIGAAVNEAVSAGAASPASAPTRLSGRPQRKPGSARLAAPSSSLLSANAVEGAIAAAIEASPAPPGGIALSALRSSPLPPRASPRGESAAPDAAAEAAAAQVAALGPVPPTAAPAVDNAVLEAQSAAMAERRRIDDELQREVEARIRARASADAKIEAQQRAAAEARARAQVAAEERAAAANRQPVRAAEIDDEPELIAAANSGSTSATVASNATIARGMDLRRTVLIGVIGAGPASRGLIRLRNGRIVTVRLGDKIDGGTITSIGNSRVTYVKSGRPFELKMLDGR